MPISAPDPLLQVSGLTAGYGKIIVLRDIALTIGAGEAVALLGPNGAGKTTLLRALSGLLPRTGQVRFAGQDIATATPRETVKAGLVHVVEGHRVFTQLSVFDNLLLDEPAAGLSNDEIERLAGLIKAISARGTGVLLVEHHADLIFDICDRVTVLNLGKVLAAGTPAEIRSHREVVSAYLGA